LVLPPSKLPGENTLVQLTFCLPEEELPYYDCRQVQTPRQEAIGSLEGLTVSHYKIREKLGGGGMGVVYLAEDSRLERLVAIKFLPPAYFENDQAVKRFQREAKAAAALNHPHICTVYDIGEYESQPYLVMEHLEGETLKHRLAKGPLPTTESLKLSVQIADALQEAHQKGIIHRDVKPANIFVTKRGDAKVLDFGLAKHIGKQAGFEEDLSTALTSAGSTLGTLTYMSPEQVKGEVLDVRTDIFSLGVVVYEMVTGVHPFRRKSLMETAAAIQIESPVPLSTYNENVPELLQHTVAKMLIKDPEQRYQVIHEVRTNLQQLGEDSGRLLSADSKTRDQTDPKRRVLWVGLAIVVIVVVVGALTRLPFFSGLQDTPVTELEPIPLTSYPGEERQPAFSPDGSQVAFTWNGPRQENFDIYIKVIGSEEPRRITMDPAVDGSPVWSPDGQQIAFLRETSSGNSNVRLISPNGGPERVLAAVATAPFHGLTWSPDGRNFAVRDRPSPAEPPGIFLLNSETGEKRRLTFPPSDSEFGDWMPTFSPGGGTVAFLRLMRNLLTVGVFLVPVAGVEPTQLLTTNAPEGRVDLTWTSSGEEIIFTAPRSFPDAITGSARFLWRISINGGQAQRFAGTEGARDVVSSPEGSRLAFSKDLTQRDIWRIDLQDDKKPQTRFIASTQIDGNPQFSPDGKQIAFTSGRSGSFEIWLADQDASNLLQLTQLGKVGAVGSPRWSPDGKVVAFDHERIGNTDIYVVSSSGGPVRRITWNPASEVGPSWSRDGDWIYFASNRSNEWQVWKVPVAGEEVGSARQITQQGGFLSIESTDGEYLYYSKKRSHEDDPKNAIWRIPVEGGEEEPVIETLDSSHTNWDITAEGIYFVDNTSTSEPFGAVNCLRFDDHSVTQLTQLKNKPFLAGPAFSVSPDGRWILSGQVESGADLMLVENFR
jgi:serine/threonine protein kinase